MGAQVHRMGKEARQVPPDSKYRTTPRERECIRGCGTRFASTWEGDRVCPECREIEADHERRDAEAYCA